MTHIWPIFFLIVVLLFFPPFSLVPTESISLTRVEKKSFIFCHNRYVAQNKLPVHSSLPVCTSLGSGRPISKTRSTNQFCMTIQGQPLLTPDIFTNCTGMAGSATWMSVHWETQTMHISYLKHSLSSISTETLFSSANIQSWFDFFPFPHGCCVHSFTPRLQLPRTQKIDTLREDEIFQ